MKAIYLFTGADGHSHFKIGSIINQSLVRTVSTQFKETSAFSSYDWHNAPVLQFVITLKGKLEFKMHDNSTFVIEPGDVLIANDLTGSGHQWKLIDDDPWQRAYCVFSEPLTIDSIFKADE